MIQRMGGVRWARAVDRWVRDGEEGPDDLKLSKSEGGQAKLVVGRAEDLMLSIPDNTAAIFGSKRPAIFLLAFLVGNMPVPGVKKHNTKQKASFWGVTGLQTQLDCHSLHNVPVSIDGSYEKH